MSMDDLERCPRRYTVLAERTEDGRVSLYQVRCEDCPESAVIAEFKRARYVGRCHAHFQSHQVIVEVFE